MRILLAEDDAMMGRAVRQGLADAGHSIDWVRDATSARTALADTPYEFLLLDLGLPEGDGMAILRELRGSMSALPVIIVTARDAVGARISGLDAGADDYILKPFDLDELFARMRAVLRRHGNHATPELHCGNLVLDPREKIVRIAGAPVMLSAREYALLDVLMRHQNRFMTRRQLEEALYGWSDDIDSNVVEVYLHRLRRKIGTDRINNQRGMGYRLRAVGADAREMP
ncbi:response regulator transcription factor [Xanthobacter autotrophicus]|uniref:response regulator n=1 Tax=Xanthobacter autotrophicus TaxID=280 RepID=UPI00372A5470